MQYVSVNVWCVLCRTIQSKDLAFVDLNNLIDQYFRFPIVFAFVGIGDKFEGLLAMQYLSVNVWKICEFAFNGSIYITMYYVCIRPVVRILFSWIGDKAGGPSPCFM